MKTQTQATPIATSERVSFWRHGDNVLRVNEPIGPRFSDGAAFDVYGMPLGARWECTVEHWNRFRAVFNWARDVR